MFLFAFWCMGVNGYAALRSQSASKPLTQRTSKSTLNRVAAPQQMALHKNPIPIWPIHHAAFDPKRPIKDVIQPTISGRWESGLYGCVRDQGQRFHEGIDIKSLHRDRRNIPQDLVCACLDGDVVYCNTNPRASNYGRYIVLWHHDGGIHFYTLYAHLASINKNLKVGQHLAQGHVLGQMGHSSNLGIPLERAHLHFEVGLKLGAKKTFGLWYRRKFKSPNLHGEWNGLNLTGLDPLVFFRANVPFSKFLHQQPIAFTLQIPSSKIPVFLHHNPGCCAQQIPTAKIFGWEVDFNWVGAPLHWRPVQHPLEPKKVVLVKYNIYELQTLGNRHTLEFNAFGQPFLGETLQRQLFELFGETFTLR